MSKCEKIINKKLGTNDFIAAAWASRKNYLNGVIDEVKKQSEIESPHYTLLHPRAPHTGVYLICNGNNNYQRCVLDPNETKLEGLVIEPRPPIAQVAAIVQHFFPERFGSVVGRGEGMSFNEGNVFNRRYFAYEIPEEFTGIITNKPHQVISSYKRRGKKS